MSHGDAARPRAEEVQLNEIAKQVAAQYRNDTLSPSMVSGLLRIYEFLLIAASGFLVFYHYVGVPGPLTAYYFGAILCCASLSVALLEFARCYSVHSLFHPFRRIGLVAGLLALSFALLAVIGFFLKISDVFSRVWLAGWFAMSLISVGTSRIILSRLFQRWARNGRIERRAVIVGGGKNAETLIRALEEQPYNDIRICGMFDDRDDRRSPPLVAGYPKLGTVSELIEFARIAHIDLLIVAIPITAEERVLTMLKKLWVLPVDIRLSAHSTELTFRPRAYSYIGAVPMLDVMDKPINDWDSVAKRIFDIVFSLIGIILFSPIMVATAIAIKLDSKGPILFKQKRHGFNNEEIDVYKFRSMYTEMSDPTAKKAVTRNDPRVTRVGRIIRKTSIDELPQFFNALLGSLSLVGPRPHAVSAQTHNLLYNEVIDGYFARHRVKPGVTGWAQINGFRGEMDTNEKIRLRTEYDLFYIENWSLWFDLKILVLTPVRLLNTENAY
ncbi:undecaprenyl-phosphate glucose phosphotransferase [Limoniibacter endophyticus]|uniref:undecaprenyl-phosphate glucose phosphotransferase n=1 Tax=Limoniibacter endophyticus TaxID=1565040 RepID=UPI001FCEEF2F|nr:undecaprenyl-phosphate glucose phosphotransferase [Limoniibacter endophyticus]